MVTITVAGDSFYLIYDPDRKGYLTWNHDNKIYILAFTSSDKAEEYNEKVMRYKPGIIVKIHRLQSKMFARDMVKKGVHYMILNYPVATDDEFAPLELKRDYCIVFLKKIVDIWEGR